MSKYRSEVVVKFVLQVEVTSYVNECVVSERVTRATVAITLRFSISRLQTSAFNMTSPVNL